MGRAVSNLVFAAPGKPKSFAVVRAFPVSAASEDRPSAASARPSPVVARVRDGLVLRVVAKNFPVERNRPDEQRAR